MAGSFFDTLSTPDKQRIAETTDALVEILTEWAPPYPILRPTRIPMAALSTALAFATATPRLSPADYLPLSKMTLWIFGVDDVTDERLVPFAEVRVKAQEWYSIAQQDLSSKKALADGDELTTILLEIRAQLSKSLLFEPLREQWASSLRDVLEGILREYQYGLDYTADRAALPSLDEYVHYGRCSIGVPLWGLTVLIILGDPSARDNFESATEAIRYAGTAIRLYNDLKSFDREMQEGNINSIVILDAELHAKKDRRATEASTLSEAKQQVLQLADSYAQKCYNLTGQLQAGSRQFQEAVARTVAFHAYFYHEHDYHLTSLTEINAMLGSTGNINSAAGDLESSIFQEKNSWQR